MELVDFQSELAVIGSVILDPDIYPSLADKLITDDFYDDENKKIWDSLLSLINTGKPIDTVVLQSMGNDLVRLLEAQEAVVSSLNAVHYADLVKDKSIRRRLVSAADKIKTIAVTEDDSTHAVSLAEDEVRSITGNTNQEIEPISKILVKVSNTLDNMADGSCGYNSISTGIKTLDDVIGGMSLTDLIIVAARPGMGKSALGSQLLLAAGSGVYFSLEMSKDQLCIRMLAQESGLDCARIANGKLTEHENVTLRNAMIALSEKKIFIDDRAGNSMSSITAACRRLFSEHELKIIIVDYIQLICGGKGQNREQEVADISRNLKRLAKELNVPVVALSQLNRGVEARDDKRPRLSDLRESGAIEQDADEVIFIYRDDYYNPDTDCPGVAELNVVKNRDGVVGKCDVNWDSTSTSFKG